jgi:predicted acyltransferase
VVNNPGSWDHIYAPLEHSEWNGFTPTDFVFPNFLFIVGVSIVLALSRKKENREGFGRIMAMAFRRGAILFALGVFITAFVINFDFPHLRIPGVLQRIGVVFVICSALYMKMGNRSMAVTAFGLLILYYVLLNFVPVPGAGPANLGMDTNLGAWLDRLIFTPAHLFRFTKTWDPEGLLTTIPSVATGLFGVLTGTVFKSALAPEAKLKRFFLAGALFVIAGVALNPLFPINKNLWTSSYVLLTSGLSMLLLGLSYFIIDVKGWRGWTALFMAFGVNSIFAYMCEEMTYAVLDKLPGGGGETVFHRVYTHLYEPHFTSPKNASLAWSLTMLLYVSAIMWTLYKRKITVKV